ncbi:hypothetical protein AB0M39_40960 [Streptomyces sp. NPDC051907]|uniref:hypothetical protein n=1 Tax=Streptomyces sp. NPDC051907 TaxID=3155284 RepID=UPI003432F7C0
MTEPREHDTYITPEKAAELLGHAKVSTDHAAAYARQVEADAWITDGVHEIDPERARELMRRSALRYVAERLDGKRVARYATLMLMGTWKPSPDPIPLTEDGYLVNGLNRLAAIALSGTTQQMFIVTDPRPVAELGLDWHSGPRVCDVEPLPADHPDRNRY